VTCAMDQSSGRSAAELVNEASEAELAALFRDSGEGRLARRIARAVIAPGRSRPPHSSPSGVRRRAPQPSDAGDILRRRVFQALRIAVNEELDELETRRPSVGPLLPPLGRCVVLSYHSGEDRMVKPAFAERHRGLVCPPGCLCVRRRAPGAPRLSRFEEGQRRRDRAEPPCAERLPGCAPSSGWHRARKCTAMTPPATATGQLPQPGAPRRSVPLPARVPLPPPSVRRCASVAPEGPPPRGGPSHHELLAARHRRSQPCWPWCAPTPMLAVGQVRVVGSIQTQLNAEQPCTAREVAGRRQPRDPLSDCEPKRAAAPYGTPAQIHQLSSGAAHEHFACSQAHERRSLPPRSHHQPHLRQRRDTTSPPGGGWSRPPPRTRRAVGDTTPAHPAPRTSARAGVGPQAPRPASQHPHQACPLPIAAGRAGVLAMGRPARDIPGAPVVPAEGRGAYRADPTVALSRPARGIYDRNGQTLALSIPTEDGHRRTTSRSPTPPLRPRHSLRCSACPRAGWHPEAPPCLGYVSIATH